MNNLKYLKRKLITILGFLFSLFIIISIINIYHYFQKLDTSILIVPNKLDIVKINNNEDVLKNSNFKIYKTIKSQEIIQSLYENINKITLRRTTNDISYPIYYFIGNSKQSLVLICFNAKGQIIIYDNLISGKKYRGQLPIEIVDLIIVDSKNK
ncbi:hypothetical protein [Tepidibacter formicigenes]|uniref:Uncharacterized protein n=1 Tax=Tepidibacter formicigenes DSM 15518 TaxID=1123349 RepID=A0A1M6UHN7_9FIRM|nr:hypothetical protein [Tepidibacter formicigenes]SHK68686.1 hypothetical protein SAMN02744037_02799 [Tepidibacter formicigenes DSM 15518]